MHLQSILALALLASPALAHAGKRAPLDDTLVNASLFERCKFPFFLSSNPSPKDASLTSRPAIADVASHLRARRPANVDIHVTAQPAVYRPRKIVHDIVPRAPFVREANSHLAHAVWHPVAEGHTSSPAKKTKRSLTAAEHKRNKVTYRNAYLARAAAKRRGLVAEPSTAPRIEQRAVTDKPKLVKRGLVEDEAWSKVKREFERGFEQEEGDVLEEDWSWMDHGEEAEGDEEGSMRRRSAELVDERSPVMRMETRMRKSSPLL